MGRKNSQRKTKQTRPRVRQAEKLRKDAELVAQSTAAHGRVQKLFVELKEAGVEVDRVSVAVLAATEALGDLLVSAGVISRNEYNLARFEAIEKQLTNILDQHRPEVKAA